MTAAISHITNYFIHGKNRDVFTAINVAADWAKLGSLSGAAKEVATRISSFAGEAWELFVWPQLISDSKDLVVSVQDCFQGPTAGKVKKIFLGIIALVGTGCDALDHLHVRVKVIDVAEHIPFLRGVSYIATTINDIHDYIEECINIYENHGDRWLSLLKLAKLITSVALTILAAWSFFSGVVVLPTFTLVLSTVYLGLKISIWQP